MWVRRLRNSAREPCFVKKSDNPIKCHTVHNDRSKQRNKT